MRRIPLKEIPHLDPFGQPMAEPLRYKTSILALAKAPSGGVSLEEMDLALSIEAAIAAAEAHGAEFVALEEPQYAYLANQVRNNRFPFASQAFATLARDILEAERLDANADPLAVPRIGKITPAA